MNTESRAHRFYDKCHKIYISDEINEESSEKIEDPTAENMKNSNPKVQEIQRKRRYAKIKNQILDAINQYSIHEFTKGQYIQLIIDIVSAKHMPDESSKFSPYVCDKCNYKSFENQDDYKKHIESESHKVSNQKKNC